MSYRYRTEEKPFLYPALKILPSDACETDGLAGEKFLICVQIIVRTLSLKFSDDSLNIFWDRYHDSRVQDGGSAVTSWETLKKAFENQDSLNRYHRRDELSFWNVFNNNCDFLLRFHVEIKEDFCHLELVADEPLLDEIERCLQETKLNFLRTSSKDLCSYYAQS